MQELGKLVLEDGNLVTAKLIVRESSYYSEKELIFDKTKYLQLYRYLIRDTKGLDFRSVLMDVDKLYRDYKSEQAHNEALKKIAEFVKRHPDYTVVVKGKVEEHETGGDYCSCSHYDVDASTDINDVLEDLEGVEVEVTIRVLS